jgi:DNA-binding MarR family transcriptional regulator
MQIPKRRDEIDRVREEWKGQCPHLDTRGMETIGRILRAEFMLAVRLRQTFAQFDLDASGFDVLATLRRSGPPYRLTPTALYKKLVITSGAMTHRMDALERTGLLERQTAPDDRRSMTAGLTEKGRRLIDKAMAAHMEAERQIAGLLTKEEQTVLANLLKKLLLHLEEGTC